MGFSSFLSRERKLEEKKIKAGEERREEQKSPLSSHTLELLCQQLKHEGGDTVHLFHGCLLGPILYYSYSVKHAHDPPSRLALVPRHNSLWA